MKKLLSLIVSLVLIVPGWAQVKLYGTVSAARPLTVTAAASMVNPEVAYAKTPIEKSSLSHMETAYRPVAYPKKIRISYQIAALNAMEWNTLKNRTADILNYANHNHLAASGLLEPLLQLAWSEFVPMSAYAPLTIKLNFKYAKRQSPYSYSANGFMSPNDNPVIHSKTMQVKK